MIYNPCSIATESEMQTYHILFKLFGRKNMFFTTESRTVRQQLNVQKQVLNMNAYKLTQDNITVQTGWPGPCPPHSWSARPDWGSWPSLSVAASGLVDS